MPITGFYFARNTTSRVFKFAALGDRIIIEDVAYCIMLAGVCRPRDGQWHYRVGPCESVDTHMCRIWSVTYMGRRIDRKTYGYNITVIDSAHAGVLTRPRTSAYEYVLVPVPLYVQYLFIDGREYHVLRSRSDKHTQV